MDNPPINETNPQTKGGVIPHPINIRISLPFFGRRFFLTILGGSEKRSRERLAVERLSHPLKTASNILFITGFALIFYVVAFVAIAIQSSIIEF